jgi:hypothetical protein
LLRRLQIIGFQNNVFNNTFYKFVLASRRQAPDAGRNKYLGNVWEDISQFVFRHAEERGVEDVNAMDAGKQADLFEYQSMAYANNVFHNITGKIGMFESTNQQYDTVEGFSEALRERGAMADQVGTMAESAVLLAPEQHNFRPVEGSSAIDAGVRFFVPWSLYATVGEWNFTRNNTDPADIFDEYWFMTSYYDQRQDYKNTPRYPLCGMGVTAENYVAGPLENWTDGAMVFDGKDQYARIPGETFHTPVTVVSESAKKKDGILTRTLIERTFDPELLRNPLLTTSNFLIEAYLRLDSPAKTGRIVGLMGEQAGYALDVRDGRILLTLRSEGKEQELLTAAEYNDGQWMHIIAEVDREPGSARIYIVIVGRIRRWATNPRRPTRPCVSR